MFELFLAILNCSCGLHAMSDTISASFKVGLDRSRCTARIVCVLSRSREAIERRPRQASGDLTSSGFFCHPLSVSLFHNNAIMNILHPSLSCYRSCGSHGRSSFGHDSMQLKRTWRRCVDVKQGANLRRQIRSMKATTAWPFGSSGRPRLRAMSMETKCTEMIEV